MPDVAVLFDNRLHLPLFKCPEPLFFTKNTRKTRQNSPLPPPPAPSALSSALKTQARNNKKSIRQVVSPFFYLSGAPGATGRAANWNFCLEGPKSPAQPQQPRHHHHQSKAITSRIRLNNEAPKHMIWHRSSAGKHKKQRRTPVAQPTRRGSNLGASSSRRPLGDWRGQLACMVAKGLQPLDFQLLSLPSIKRIMVENMVSRLWRTRHEA